MTTILPICFYPTRKIILDDDHAFLQSVLLKMHGNNFISYDSPKNVLNYLLHEYQPILHKTDFIIKNSNIEDSFSTQHIDIGIKKLKDLLSVLPHPDISVLLVDYHMPEMLGIDFLKEIQHLPIKKALITGEEDYKIAVDAFNSGIVDAYLRKGDPDFSTKIETLVFELEWKYFSELSNFFTNIPYFSYLKNINSINIIKKLFKEHDIKAFCLLHIQGDFIVQDTFGSQIHILFRSKSQLKELAKIAEEDNASSNVIKDLEQGKVIPFFGSKEYWETPASEWDKFLYPAMQISNDLDLVWAKVDSRNNCK